MQRAHRVFALILVLSLTTIAAAADPPASEALQKLLKQRVELVTQIHELTDRSYRAGAATFSELLEARAELLTARLDACATKSERLQVREEMVKLAQQTEALTAQLVKSGEATSLKQMRATAQVLEAQIALEREKAQP